jgi:hypothetical protein
MRTTGKKFKRAYQLTVNPNFGAPPLNFSAEASDAQGEAKQNLQNVTIAHPLINPTNGNVSNGITAKFSVKKGISNTNNTATIELYNLNENTRKFLIQDIYNVQEKDRTVNLFAGYMGTDNRRQIFDLIFTGTLTQAGSRREGTEIITKLICEERGFRSSGAAAFVNTTISGGGTFKDILKVLLESIGFTTNNVIANKKTLEQLNNPAPPTTLIGNGRLLLRERFNRAGFISDNNFYILEENEGIKGVVPVITSETGLIGTPERQETLVRVRTIFEPRIRLGQVLSIKSDITPEFNGQYKVHNIEHSGVISPSQSGDLITTLELFIGTARTGSIVMID